ncbi:hypothetical protein B0O80DRAFT_530387 [Mortierella sp. GBAus27b]|nr:hypothetical protein BGX31_008582 [Mortierella sp. GBA43]KAI8351841.1 hypothetical protein B0O80DRAFT_530387 [Mortierella sp. GBAus27b]
MNKVNPLDIPEILTVVGSYVTIWHPCGIHFTFSPQDMLSCLQVSRLFRNTFLPIFWYTFDERAMMSVPIDVIRKYTHYFRAHYNYGSREDYPTNDREPCTSLVQLTLAGGMSEAGAKYVMNNSGLRYLKTQEVFQASTVVSLGIFNNLKQLESLRYTSINHHWVSHQTLFQPICGSLRFLDLKCFRGSFNIKGLIWTKLKELIMELYNAQDILDLLQGSPNLEVLTCVHYRIESGVTVATGSEYTLQALSSGACPKLKSLDLIRMKCSLPTRNLAEVLGNRSALEKLAMNLFDIDK